VLVRRVSCANPSRTAIPPNGYRITEQEPRLVEVLGELGSRPPRVGPSIPSAHIVSSKPRDGCSSRSALPPPPRKKNEKEETRRTKLHRPHGHGVLACADCAFECAAVGARLASVSA
jgi:hypothetical protein